MMRDEFVLVAGPVFGLPGNFLRIVIGLAEFLAGIAMVFGNMVPEVFGEDVISNAALRLMAQIGFISIMIGAAYMHAASGVGSAAPPVIMAIILGGITYAGWGYFIVDADAQREAEMVWITNWACFTNAGVVFAIIISLVLGEKDPLAYSEFNNALEKFEDKENPDAGVWTEMVDMGEAE